MVNIHLVYTQIFKIKTLEEYDFVIVILEFDQVKLCLTHKYSYFLIIIITYNLEKGKENNLKKELWLLQGHIFMFHDFVIRTPLHTFTHF